MNVKSALSDPNPGNPIRSVHPFIDHQDFDALDIQRLSQLKFQAKDLTLPVIIDAAIASRIGPVMLFYFLICT